MVKVIDQPFVPMIENTPPIDNRFVYKTLYKFYKSASLHYNGCISYIKESDTYIQTTKDGYCQALNYRIGIMDITDFVNFTSQNYSHFFEVSIMEHVREGNCEISIYSGKYEGGVIFSGEQERKNLEFYNKYMLGYDILLDFTNNIFAYKCVKNKNLKKSDDTNDIYVLDDLCIKFAALNQNDSNYDIYSKIRSVFGKAYNNIQSANNFDDLKSHLGTAFQELKDLYPNNSSNVNSKLYKTYDNFRNETTGKTNISISRGGNTYINHEDHL